MLYFVKSIITDNISIKYFIYLQFTPDYRITELQPA